MEKIRIKVSHGTEISSLNQALECVRSERSRLNNDLPAEIVLENGEYFTEGLSLGSGDGNIVFTAEEGAKALVTGGIHLDMSRAEKVSDQKLISKLISEKAREDLYRIDISDIIDKIGDMQSMLNRHGAAFYRDGLPMEPARWPKRKIQGDTLTDHNWFFSSQIFHDSNKTAPFHMCIDLAQAEHIKQFWSEASLKNVWISGYFFHNWHYESYKVSEIDTEKPMVHVFDAPSSYRATNEPLKYRRFYYRNIFEELGGSCEYYIDFENKLFYFIGNTGDIVFTAASGNAIHTEDTSNVTVSGLTLGFYKENVLDFHGGSDITVKGCEIMHGSLQAIETDGSKNVHIFGNHIFDMGSGGVSISGAGCMKTFENGGVLIEENDIHNVSRLLRCYATTVSTKSSVGTTIRKNRLHGSPHMLVFINGIDTIFEKNELYDAVLDSDDASAIYWGRSACIIGTRIRYNYFHDIGQNDTATWSIAAIYNDDIATSCEICGNIFNHAALFGDDNNFKRGDHNNSTIALNGAQFSNVHNNVFIMSSVREHPVEDVRTYETYGWIKNTIGAYIPGDGRTHGGGMMWHHELEDIGFFSADGHTPSEQWKEHYKGTQWEGMAEILCSENYFKGLFDSEGYKYGVPDITDRVRSGVIPYEEAFNAYLDYVKQLVERKYGGDYVTNSFCDNLIIGMNPEFIKSDGDSVVRTKHHGNIYITLEDAAGVFEDAEHGDFRLAPGASEKIAALIPEEIRVIASDIVRQ
ncbi:MAG: right-handed parallel beta-helix repeat-containing protein [Firmicutes bacterium]|nr:right-handed parallel beta-helix repeat-containing protein [Bacillota bacterium]